MTDWSLSEIEQIIKVIKENDLDYIEMPGLKIKLKETATYATQKKQDILPIQTEELIKPLSVLDQMTDEEIKYYATPYYDELQAKKDLHQKKLDEELKEMRNGKDRTPEHEADR